MAEAGLLVEWTRRYQSDGGPCFGKTNDKFIKH